MIRLIHIHTDPKFIFDSVRFKDKDIFNFIIFLGESDEYVLSKIKGLNFKYRILPKSKVSIQLIANEYKEFNGSVLYDLCRYKVQLTDLFPNNHTFFLRLFGYELYLKLVNKYISNPTLKAAYPISLKNYSLKDYITRKISRIRGKEFIFETEVEQYNMRRVDAILLFSKQEYHELTNYITLPPLIQLNLNENFNLIPSNKENKIIIGNSRALWNNHLDILKIIQRSKNTTYQYKLFFNYGPENDYTELVRKTCLTIENCKLEEGFLSIDRFEEIYMTAAALVINSYRQHALGNIFTAIKSGCKIYLNPISSTYKWLTAEGLSINTISDFETDLRENNMELTERQQLENITRFSRVADTYTKKEFLQKIKAISIK